MIFKVNVARAAHAKGVPAIVDSAVASPARINPIECGADIVVYSLTRYIVRDRTTLGGI